MSYGKKKDTKKLIDQNQAQALEWALWSRQANWHSDSAHGLDREAKLWWNRAPIQLHRTGRPNPSDALRFVYLQHYGRVSSRFDCHNKF